MACSSDSRELCHMGAHACTVIAVAINGSSRTLPTAERCGTNLRHGGPDATCSNCSQAAGDRPVSKHIFLEKEGASADAITSVILDVAQEQAADLIVIAGHHAGSSSVLWEKLTGSVARSLTACSPFPVMVVKGWPLQEPAAATASVCCAGLAPLIGPQCTQHVP